jgi:hypothetical protein
MPKISNLDRPRFVRLLDRALAMLHKTAVKYELPILATRRQPPPGTDHSGVGGEAGRWRDAGGGRRWGQLATARLAVTVAAEPGHARAQFRGHQHSVSVRLAADGWAERPPLGIRVAGD